MSTGHGRFPRRERRSPRIARLSNPPADDVPNPAHLQQGAIPSGDTEMPATTLNAPQTFGAPNYADADRNVGREEAAGDIAQLMAPTINTATQWDQEHQASVESPSKGRSNSQVAPSRRRDTSVETSSGKITSPKCCDLLKQSIDPSFLLPVYQNTRSRQRRNHSMAHGESHDEPAGASQLPSRAPSRAASRVTSNLEGKDQSHPPPPKSARSTKKATRSAANAPLRPARASNLQPSNQSFSNLGADTGLPNVSTSFGDESGAFGTTTLPPSGWHYEEYDGGPSTPVNPSHIPPSEPPFSQPRLSEPSVSEQGFPEPDYDQNALQDLYMHGAARENGVFPVQRDHRNWARNFSVYLKRIGAFLRIVWELVSWLIVISCLVMMLAIVYSATPQDFRQRLGLESAPQDSFRPHRGSEGLFSSWDSPSWNEAGSTWKTPKDIISDIAIRITGVETDLSFLKTQFRLHSSSIEKLEEILPDKIAVKAAWDGKHKIDNEFWSALKQKIELDFKPLLPTGAAGEGMDQKFMDYLAQTQWESLIEKNNQRVLDQVESLRSQFQSRWNDDTVLTKTQFLSLLADNFGENAQRISEMDKKLREKYEAVETGIEDKIIDIATGVATTISTVNIKSAIPASQLNALAQANLKINTDTALKKVNFFSPGLGAVIDPYLTSPTYVKPHTFTQRSLSSALNLGIRKPNPPATALEPWNDNGDCWCSPSESGMAQIAVLLPRTIYPSEVTIDHIPIDATLDIRSAPRQIEVFAQIKDRTARQDALHLAEKKVPEPMRSNKDDLLDESWVRIGFAIYDIFSINHIQTFPIQANLGLVNAGVNKLVVRSRANWGSPQHVCLYRVRIHGELVNKAEGNGIFVDPKIYNV
ncbi:MAG: hypothetical protein M1837_001140 [Sclerophora amabilis]|nr:MAG: hypothetical protein M1837_001140 [Sclerophora amabilis]